MSKPEFEGAMESAEAGPPLGEVYIPMPSLVEGDFNDTEITNPARERELLEMLTVSKPQEDENNKDWSKWFRKISRDIGDKRSGWFYPTIGGIVVFIGAAWVEFGLRRGKDIKELIVKVDEYKANKTNLRRKTKTT